MTDPAAHDEHGNPVFAVDPLSPAGQLVALLEWARRRGFRLGPTVKIGDLVVQVQDLRQDEGSGIPRLDDSTIWEQAGHREEGDR